MIAPRTLPFAVHAYDAMLLLHVFFFSCTRDCGQKKGIQEAYSRRIWEASFRLLLASEVVFALLTRQVTR